MYIESAPSLLAFSLSLNVEQPNGRSYGMLSEPFAAKFSSVWRSRQQCVLDILFIELYQVRQCFRMSEWNRFRLPLP